jgi:hypothetical protein
MSSLKYGVVKKKCRAAALLKISYTYNLHAFKP